MMDNENFVGGLVLGVIITLIIYTFVFFSMKRNLGDHICKTLYKNTGGITDIFWDSEKDKCMKNMKPIELEMKNEK